MSIFFLKEQYYKERLEESLKEKDIYVLSDHGRFIAMAICRMDGSVTTITDLCVVKEFLNRIKHM